ncbi:unnamed protein product [Darwinula stevensoni]|uniref:Uncharacterized protein n=1 Tax=Darwinula stevensoni TaxID=69355 RepID=A0A7R9AHB1_9CRUS|nr:unnamed protein product [Darwinula stevensoni]CAG0905321.1 unnamed protein product [Darwinula stevensoni]
MKFPAILGLLALVGWGTALKCFHCSSIQECKMKSLRVRKNCTKDSESYCSSTWQNGTLHKAGCSNGIVATSLREKTCYCQWDLCNTAAFTLSPARLSLALLLLACWKTLLL